MDDEQRALKKPDALVKKDIPPRLTAITAMINRLFKDARPTVTGSAKSASLHDTLTAFCLPDPDTTATWTADEKANELEIVAVDANGVILVRGKIAGFAGQNWSEDGVTLTGGQSIDMNLGLYQPTSKSPTDLLRFSLLAPQKVSAATTGYIEPGTAHLTHQHVYPFSRIQFNAQIPR